MLPKVLVETFVADLIEVNCSREVMVGEDPESNQKTDVKDHANGVLRNLAGIIVGQFVHSIANNAECKQAPY